MVGEVVGGVTSMNREATLITDDHTPTRRLGHRVILYTEKSTPHCS